MVKKTNVRIKDGTLITDTLKANLQEIIQQELVFKTYSESPDLQSSYTSRINSFEEAFLFIMKAIPPDANEKEILGYLDWCKTQAVMPPVATIGKYQDILAQYTAFLIDALVDYWFPVTLKEEKAGSFSSNKKVKEATELLNKAEQYVLMKKGRSDLATLTTVGALGEEKLVLQWEKQLPPCSDETLAELDVIKNSNLKVTPTWFRALPSYQQVYFQTKGCNAHDFTNLKIDINSLSDKWIQVKDLITPADWGAISSGDGNVLEEKFKFTADQQAVIKAISSKLWSLNEVEAEIKKLGDSLPNIDKGDLAKLSELRKVPYWFLLLPEHEQLLLKTCLLEQENVQDAVSFLPSRLRTIPGLANFGVHRLSILSVNGVLEEDFPERLRLSNPSSRDVKDQPYQISDLHTLRNIQRLLDFAEGKPLLVQALISPIYVRLLQDIIPDYALDEQRRKIVTLLQNKNIPIYSTNHPLNIANRFYPTDAKNEECNALYNGIKIHLFPYETFEVFKGCDLLECKNLIDAAFKEVGIALEEADFYEGLEQNTSEKRSDKEKLVDFFKDHYNDLSQAKGWQSVFAKYSYLANNSPSNADLLKLMANYSDIEQVNSDYFNLLNSGAGTATIWDYNGRELFLSSLENLQFLLTGGIGSGACVSGKDRKAVELTHTDAMLIYRHRYGEWPNINDKGTDRENFVHIVSDLYISRHAHYHAGENADGADGINHPYKYWPKDIAEAILKKTNPSSLIIDDILATNNEADRIGNKEREYKSPRHWVKNHFARSVIAAKRLDARGQAELLTALKIVVEEMDHWANQKWSVRSLLPSWTPAWTSRFVPQSAPAGVAKMKEVLTPAEGASTHLPDMEKLAHVYYELNQREEESANRSPSTQALYLCLRRLYHHNNPNEILPEVLNQLEEIKQEIFARNSEKADCGSKSYSI